MVEHTMESPNKSATTIISTTEETKQDALENPDAGNSPGRSGVSDDAQQSSSGSGGGEKTESTSASSSLPKPPDSEESCPDNTLSNTRKTIADLPPEITDRILQEIRRPSHLAALCLASKKLQALAAPRLYKNIELVVTQGTMFTPRLLHCLIIPEQRNLVHCKQVAIYGEFKRDLVEDYERCNSATEHMYGVCLLLRDVLRKIPQDQLQGFLWYPDASPHSIILEHLRKYQTRIEDLRLFMPLFKPDYRTLLNIGDCKSLTTLHVGNIQTAAHLSQINNLLEKGSSIESLRLEIESSVSLEERRLLLVPESLMKMDTKHRPTYVRLAYFPLAEIQQSLKSYLNLDHLIDLVLISCENDKELLQAMVASKKSMKIHTFELVTPTPDDIPEFLTCFKGLKHLHLFFKEMDAGFSTALIDSILHHKETLETLVLDGRFRTHSTAVAPKEAHLAQLRKLEKLRDFAFSPEHYSSEAEMKTLHALLPPTLRAINCRVTFNNEIDRPHWSSGYALNFVTCCLKSYSRPFNTDDWGASFGVADENGSPQVSRGFDPRQLEIFALGDGSDTKQMIYTVEIVKDRHGGVRPLVVETTRDEVDYVCEMVPRFLYFRHY